AETTVGGPLATKLQEFPPKIELVLPPATRGRHEWSFAGVAAVGDDVYFELHPLGLDATLRDRISPSLWQRCFRRDDGFKLAGDGASFHDEVRVLIASSYEWFMREIVAARPLPPCQFLDQYLVEPVDWLNEKDQEKEPGFDFFAGQATYR